MTAITGMALIDPADGRASLTMMALAAVLLGFFVCHPGYRD